jgi:hypothetical protein
VIAPAGTSEDSGQEYASRLSRKKNFYSGKEDFRFLLAILAGVAIATAVAALQKMMELVAWRLEFLMLTTLWVTAFTAVILVYLSVKYGSLFIDQRIDAAENVGLMVVTVTECAMFIAVTLGPGPNLSLRWFISLSAFGFFTSCTVALVYRRLVREYGNQADGKMGIYIRSLRVDMTMAMITCVVAAIYIVIEPHPSTLSTLIAGVMALTMLISAILFQRRVRQQLFDA